VQSGTSVAYDPVGSGSGQKQLLARAVDFGASDVPMSAETLAAAPGRVVQVPVAIGAVVPVYSLGRGMDVRFSGPVLADIFLGKIRTWNDPALVKLNPDLTLPKLPITVVFRKESSGSAYVFTDFLSKSSPDFANKVGTLGKPTWPIGKGVDGAEGVVEAVSKTFGAIGFTELSLALSEGLATGSVRNAAGRFVRPTRENLTSAAESSDASAEDRYSITDAPGVDAYPIATFTYVMAFQEQGYAGRSMVQARAVKDLLEWMVSDAGQRGHAALNFAPLPQSVVGRARRAAQSLTFGGARLP